MGLSWILDSLLFFMDRMHGAACRLDRLDGAWMESEWSLWNGGRMVSMQFIWILSLDKTNLHATRIEPGWHKEG